MLGDNIKNVRFHFPHFSSYYTPKHDSYYDNQGVWPPPSYFKSALCREEDVQFWRGQLGFHCIYKWADKKHISHPQSASMMGWIWRMMTAPGLDTQVFKREQSGGQDAAPTLKYQCSLLPKGFTDTHASESQRMTGAWQEAAKLVLWTPLKTRHYPQFLASCDVRKQE